jgi:hypothetical protein
MPQKSICFRNAKHVFNNGSIINLEYVTCTEESNVERAKPWVLTAYECVSMCEKMII